MSLPWKPNVKSNFSYDRIKRQQQWSPVVQLVLQCFQSEKLRRLSPMKFTSRLSSSSSSSSSSSPLCRVFTLIFLRQTMSLENSVAAILSFLFMVHTSLAPVLNLIYYYMSTFRSVSCPIWLFSVVPWFRAFPVCCSRIFLMILRSSRIK